MLCFGAGNEDVGRDFEFEAPEFLFAGEMLGGLAGSAAGDQFEEALRVGVGDGFFRMRVEPGAIAAKGVEKKQLGCEREGRSVCLAELRDAALQ